MNLLKVPLYIKAKTEDDLVREMIRNNIKNKITYKYFDIKKNGQYWFAWYLGDANSIVKNNLASEIKNNG